MEFVETIRLPLGVQILSVDKEDNLLYIGGRFNTTIGASELSGGQDNPWCGIYLVFDYENKKVVSYDYIGKIIVD